MPDLAFKIAMMTADIALMSVMMVVWTVLTIVSPGVMIAVIVMMVRDPACFAADIVTAIALIGANIFSYASTAHIAVIPSDGVPARWL
jgi:hypothetical protein